MEDKIKLSIVTPDGTAFEQMVSYVNIPASFGSLGILSGHAPMLCAVGSGILRCGFGEEQGARIRISDGIANVADNEVTVLVSSAEVV